MNCPYCDEGIHPMAKFCPKCGLPLKEDSTLVGAYLSDDTGPGPVILGVGALAVAVLALGIGWFSTRKPQPAQNVRREPVRSYFAPSSSRASAAWGTPAYGAYGSTSAYGNNAVQAPGPSVDWNFRANYVAPPPPVRRPRVERPDPLPPPVPLLAMHLARPRRKPVVYVQAAGPLAPPSPRSFLPAGMAVPPGFPVGAPGWSAPGTPGYAPGYSPGYAPILPGAGVVYPSGGEAARPEYTSLRTGSDGGSVELSRETDGRWVWDPVQQRFALRPEAGQRSGR